MNDNEELTLEEKMALAQGGDRKAYAVALEEISKIVRIMLSKKISSKHDLEDIVQEILISIHKARNTYDSKRPIKPWIAAITTYRLNDFLRKYYRQSSREVVDYDTVENYLSDDVTKSEDDNETLNKALEFLPKKQRQIVVMMKIEGHSAREVAKSLGMNVSAVKVSAHRAYKKLKEIIQV